MHRTRAIVAVILIAVGLVWIGQGSGILKGGSFMVGDVRWALIGAAAFVAGLAMGWYEVSHRQP